MGLSSLLVIRTIALIGFSIMNSISLSDYFEGIAYKYLSTVDSDPSRSNQHEFGGLVKAGFRDYLGDPGSETFYFDCTFLYFSEEEDDSISHRSRVSWYDSRRGVSTRGPELRLYYDSNPVTEAMKPDDFFFIGKLRDNSLIVAICQRDSTPHKQLCWLFGINDVSERFSGFGQSRISSSNLSFAALKLLESIGIEFSERDDSVLEMLLERFGNTLPKTRDFSAFAREYSEFDNVRESPDRALMTWMQTEERLFRIFEKHIVEARLREGFTDVDGFVSYSLSVHNRRKSRVGFALENHVEAIFMLSGLPYTREGVTENRSRPDFILPGVAEYRNPDWDAERLFMLGVKSTCKDRWRQVLSEAARIRAKHLLTMEPAISEHQTDEMQSVRLGLVVPEEIQASYSPAQQQWLMSLAGFIGMVRQRLGG